MKCSTMGRAVWPCLAPIVELEEWPSGAHGEAEVERPSLSDEPERDLAGDLTHSGDRQPAPRGLQLGRAWRRKTNGIRGSGQRVSALPTRPGRGGARGLRVRARRAGRHVEVPISAAAAGRNGGTTGHWPFTPHRFWQPAAPAPVRPR
jgi:hypothetical protein